ncbi:SGNH/GDSL hydrolase family protein [Rhizobium sp. RU20A]|uniref:SGNH/GDSL hydrolase family protein n=1 Tax=Rhizobium sp. RU20A TaxID=1907412 RepID=UPI00122D1C74|nr:SGNH/GDSL hydrolase family protein [Rhizobium sp. RU20A]
MALPFAPPISNQISAAERTGRYGDNFMCCATRGRVPYIVSAPTEAANSQADTRKRFRIGGSAQAAIKLGYSGFAVVSDGPMRGRESLPGNHQHLLVSVEIPTAPTPVVVCTFRGDLEGVLKDGDAIYFTDQLLPQQFGLKEFAANLDFMVRETRRIEIGDRFTRYGQLFSHKGEGTVFGSSDFEPQYNGSGPLSVGWGQSMRFCCFGPSLIVGRAAGATGMSILAIGDSILNGSNDAAFGGSSDGSDEQGGWFTRGSFNVNGSAVPHTLMAFNATTISQMLHGGNGSDPMMRRREFFRYFTHFVENFGTNDFGDQGRSSQEVLNDKKALWKAIRETDTRDRHITSVTIIPRVSSSDEFKTVKGQQPNPGYEDRGQSRWKLNLAVLELQKSGIGPDSVFDLDAVLRDETHPDRFAVSDGAALSNDGTHPSVSGSKVAAEAFNKYLSQLR